MKSDYVLQVEDSPMVAIASLDDALATWWLRRINVPQRFRGKGYGTKLLRLVLADADAEGVDLYLDVHPSGALSHDQLIAWYERHGFVQETDHSDWFMHRSPKGNE